MRCLRLALLPTAIASVASSCTDRDVPTPPDPSTVRAPSFARPPAPPTVDGAIGAGEYAGAATLTFDADLPGGGTAPVTVYLRHDGTYLYLAATFDRGSDFHTNDLVAFEFDNDNDGTREDGDDILLAGPTDPGDVITGGDFYRFAGGTANQSDVGGTGTIDVIAAFGVSGTTTGVFELRHDLDSDDDAHDFSIDPAPPQTVGLIVQVSLEAEPSGSGVYTHTFKPSFESYCQLTISKKNATVTCPP